MLPSSHGGSGGPELYNEIHRLIAEWKGLDAGDQTAALPKLVADLVRLKMASVTTGNTLPLAAAA